MDAFHSFIHWFVNMSPLEAISISVVLMIVGSGGLACFALSLANKSGEEEDRCREVSTATEI